MVWKKLNYEIFNAEIKPSPIITRGIVVTCEVNILFIYLFIDFLETSKAEFVIKLLDNLLF